MSMLSTSMIPPRKAKISLNDYPFRRDVEVRLLMARLTTDEIEILREIIHHSLKISIEQLANDLGMQIGFLLPILDKLSMTKLFKRQNMMLVVDKDMRKYFETKIEKFDDDFRPDIDFLQSMLSKVPIHILPLWYAIPRSSDNIFESIIEKYFLTPKIYRQYLSELQFDNPLLKSIMQEVYQTPHFMVTTDDLMAKFNVSHEDLEEYLLLLEYHFVCCLSYKRINESWQEVVTPFAEWHEFLQFEYENRPKPIPLSSIKKDNTVEFAFMKDLITLVQACQSKKILLKNVKNLNTQLSDQQNILVNKLIQIELVKQNAAKQLIATEKGKEWLEKPFFEQIAILASDPLNTLSTYDEFAFLWNGRNFRLIEKSLRRLASHEWIDIATFLEGITIPIGDKEPVTLKNKGKKWRYVLPLYTDQEKQFIQNFIMERLAELGMVETGLFKDKLCFCLTPFGYHMIH